jgi:hypothetical protein
MRFIEEMIDRFDQTNQNGQYTPFYQMLIYCLTQEKQYQ